MGEHLNKTDLRVLQGVRDRPTGEGRVKFEFENPTKGTLIKAFTFNKMELLNRREKHFVRSAEGGVKKNNNSVPTLHS